MTLRFVILSGIFFIMAACDSIQTTAVTVDFRQQKGLYVVAYSADQALRSKMAQQLVDDLAINDTLAYPSFLDIDDIVSSQSEEVIAKASAKGSLGILLINQVSIDASGSLVKNPGRVSPQHPTLKEFYAYSKQQAVKPYDNNKEVFAEVNLFVLDKGIAKLYWSGTTWSFQADGNGTAIRDMSATISQQLLQLRDQYR